MVVMVVVALMMLAMMAAMALPVLADASRGQNPEDPGGHPPFLTGNNVHGANVFHPPILMKIAPRVLA